MANALGCYKDLRVLTRWKLPHKPPLCVAFHSKDTCDDVIFGILGESIVTLDKSRNT